MAVLACQAYNAISYNLASFLLLTSLRSQHIFYKGESMRSGFARARVNLLVYELRS